MLVFSFNQLKPKLTFFLVLIISFAFPTQKLNAEQTLVSKEKQSPLIFFDKKNLKLNSLLGYQSNLYKRSSSYHDSSLGLVLSPSYKISSDDLFKANISGSVQLKESQRSSNQKYRQYNFDNINSTYHQKQYQNDHLELFTDLDTILPLSDDDINKNQLRFGVGFGPFAKIELKKIGLNHFFLTLGLQARKNFHRYSTSIEGRPLVNYGVNGKWKLTFRASDKITIEHSLLIVQGWSYQNNDLPTKYVNSLSCDYELRKNLGINLSLADRKELYKTNGSSNWEFADRETATVNLGIIYEIY